MKDAGLNLKEHFGIRSKILKIMSDKPNWSKIS
jgi:hypothetical protein